MNIESIRVIRDEDISKKGQDLYSIEVNGTIVLECLGADEVAYSIKTLMKADRDTNKTVFEIGGKEYRAIESEESEEAYKDYDIYCEGDYIGNVTKYDSERYFKAWDTLGDEVAQRLSLKGAIKTLIAE